MRQPQDGDERLEGVAKDRLDAAALLEGKVLDQRRWIGVSLRTKNIHFTEN